MTALARFGGMLTAPRATLRDLSPGTGPRDGLVLLGLYTLAAAVPALGLAIAELISLGPSTNLVRGALPLFPWLISSVAIDWCLGPDRAHRTALCMVPMLLIVSVAQLLNIGGPALLGPADASMLLGGAASLVLAIALRNHIAPLPAKSDLSPGPAPAHLSPRTARIAGLGLLALVAAAAARDGVQLARSWSTLAPLGPGEPLPALTVPLLDGGALSLAALPARPHLLVFWTTWCGVCRTEMPMLRALHTRYHDRGLQILLVNSDDSPDQAALAAVYRDNNLLGELPVALDAGPLRRALRVRVYPHLVLVDAAGEPVLTHQGAIGERTLARAIESVLPR